MKLTLYQSRTLDALITFRNSKPTIWRVLKFRPLSWLPATAIVALSFAIYLYVDERYGMFCIGLSAGAILRIASHARFTVLAWPLTEYVTDWAKVDALKKEQEANRRQNRAHE